MNISFRNILNLRNLLFSEASKDKGMFSVSRITRKNLCYNSVYIKKNKSHIKKKKHLTFFTVYREYMQNHQRDNCNRGYL